MKEARPQADIVETNAGGMPLAWRALAWRALAWRALDCHAHHNPTPRHTPPGPTHRAWEHIA